MAEKGEIVRYTRRPDKLEKPTPRVDGKVASVTALPGVEIAASDDVVLAGAQVVDFKRETSRASREIIQKYKNLENVPQDRLDPYLCLLSQSQKHTPEERDVAKQELFTLRFGVQLEYLMINDEQVGISRNGLAQMIEAAVARTRNLFPKGDNRMRPSDEFIREMKDQTMERLTQAFDKIAGQPTTRSL